VLLEIRYFMIAQPLLRSYYLVVPLAFMPQPWIVINLMLHKLNHRAAVPQQYISPSPRRSQHKTFAFLPIFFLTRAADVTAMINDVASDCE
jgi:hypothetical protein